MEGLSEHFAWSGRLAGAREALLVMNDLPHEARIPRYQQKGRVEILWQRFKKVLSRLAGQQTAHPEPRLRLKLPRGWVDESGNNPQGGPTYVRAGLTDSSVVQISIQ